MGFLKNLFKALLYDTDTVPTTSNIPKEVFPDLITPFDVLFIVDTHGCLHQEELDKLYETIDLSGVEAVIFLGDVFDRDMKLFFDNFPNMANISYGILGNHNNQNDLKRYNIESLDMNPVDIGGIVFGGFGGSIKYKESADLLLTDTESISKADLLEPVDIFITHDGPKVKDKDFAHSGLEGISRYIETKKPAYHFFGHRHSPATTIEKDTISICEYQLSLYHINLYGCKQIWTSYGL